MKKSVAMLLIVIFILTGVFSVGAQNDAEYDYSSFIGEWHKIDPDGLNGDVILNISEVADNNQISFSIDGDRTLTEYIHNNQVKWTENWWDGEMGLTLTFYDNHIHLQYSRYSLEWYTEIIFVSTTIKPKRLEDEYVTTLDVSPVVKEGDIIGYAKYTDISAYINHYPITSYNINNYTAIVAEDLRNYGFNVVWDGETRSLSITKNTDATQITPYGTVYKYSAKAGRNSLPYLQTDIVTYVNGTEVESFNIDGKTCVYIDALAPYGEVAWVPEIRAIKLWISDLPARDYVALDEVPTTTMYSYDGRTTIIELSEVEAYKAVGWHTEPVITQYDMYNGSYYGGGNSIPGSIYKIGQWNAHISNATSNSLNLSFEQSESDYYIDNTVLYRQENGSYYGVGHSSRGQSYITIWIESPERISLTVSGNAEQTGTEYLYKE